MALPIITATGNITDTPALRHTKNGDAIANFRIACNERKKDADGNWTDGKTIFMNVTAWRAADAVCEELDKGMEVTVVGRLSQREYTSASGEARSSLDVDADTIARTLGRRKTAPRAQAPAFDEEPF